MLQHSFNHLGDCLDYLSSFPGVLCSLRSLLKQMHSLFISHLKACEMRHFESCVPDLAKLLCKTTTGVCAYLMLTVWTSICSALETCRFVNGHSLSTTRLCITRWNSAFPRCFTCIYIKGNCLKWKCGGAIMSPCNVVKSAELTTEDKVLLPNT